MDTTATFELAPYLGYGKEDREVEARRFSVVQSGNFIDIYVDGHEGSMIAIEWSPERGVAVRTYPDNNEPSHTIFIKDGAATLESRALED